MDKVRAQYRDNVQKQREEMAKVYQERGRQPSGRMPADPGSDAHIHRHLLRHPPIRRLPQAAPTRSTRAFTDGGILWFQDLSHADPTYLLPIISAVTMLAATEITSKNVDPQQRWLMRLLPIGFTAFLLSLPSGSLRLLDHL